MSANTSGNANEFGIDYTACEIKPNGKNPANNVADRCKNDYCETKEKSAKELVKVEHEIKEYYTQQMQPFAKEIYSDIIDTNISDDDKKNTLLGLISDLDRALKGELVKWYGLEDQLDMIHTGIDKLMPDSKGKRKTLSSFDTLIWASTYLNVLEEEKIHYETLLRSTNKIMKISDDYLKKIQEEKCEEKRLCE